MRRRLTHILARMALLALCATLWPQASLAQEGAPTAPPPPLAPAPPGFVQASGAQLLSGGQPIMLRGINYYPQGKPWADMWHYWDAPQIERELRQARDELGINVVRILIPFGWADWDKTVSGEQLAQLEQLSSIAGSLDMRIIFTLFDFADDFSGPTTRETNKQLQYLRAIVPAFANDQRVLAWDIHNEPDHYERWKRGDAQAVLGWLGMMADEIHRLAPQQLVTVGMGQYDNLWQPGPDGRRVIDYSDLVSVHIYNAADAARQLDELRSYTGKPIVMEEFGWPSGPACAVAGFDEATQLATYQQILDAAQGRTVGTLAWTLRDYDAGPSLRWSSHQEHYGLVRTDGTLKPAAELFRGIPVPPLPSYGPSGVPLTVGTNQPDDGGSRAPIRVSEGGPFLKNHFRRAWERLGGAAIFGLPLSEAYVRYEDQIVVQYFEGTVLEYHPEAENAPDWGMLDKEEQLRRLLLPLSIGRYHAEQRGFGPGPFAVAGEFAQFYDEQHGNWRLGPALSPPVVEAIVGTDTLVQYFERGRLEWDAANSAVRVGSLGTEAWRQQCAVTGW